MQVEGQCEKAQPPNVAPSSGMHIREAYVCDRGHPVTSSNTLTNYLFYSNNIFFTAINYYGTILNILHTTNKTFTDWTTDMAKEPRTFDITEYATKARAALNRLEQTQQPGQLVSGSKTDVVHFIKADIKALMDKGYTAQQVADALKLDVFNILPKSITEIVKGKKPAAVKKTRVVTSVQSSVNERAASKPAMKPAGNAGTFEITPDTPNGEL